MNNQYFAVFFPNFIDETTNHLGELIAQTAQHFNARKLRQKLANVAFPDCMRVMDRWPMTICPARLASRRLLYIDLAALKRCGKNSGSNESLPASKSRYF